MGSPHQTTRNFSGGVDVGSILNMGGGYQSGHNMQGCGGPSCNPQYKQVDMGPLSFGHCGSSAHWTTWQGGCHSWGEGKAIGTKGLATIVHQEIGVAPRYNTNVLVGIAQMSKHPIKHKM
jgi:hypothetical protein